MQLLLLSLDLLLTVQLLLFELVLKQVDLFKLRVKFCLPVLGDAAQVPHLGLERLVLVLEIHAAVFVGDVGLQLLF